MKLNLGSNNKKYDGFLNVDIRKIDGVDIVDDVCKLKKIKNDSVEHIIAHNILEHVAPDKVVNCLKLWVSKLKPNGIIEIGVPDGELIFNRYNKGIIVRREYADSPWEDVIHSIFGNIKLLRKWHGDDAEKYMHHILFNREYLEKIMKVAGLKNIKKIKSNQKDNITLKGQKINK